MVIQMTLTKTILAYVLLLPHISFAHPIILWLFTSCFRISSPLQQKPSHTFSRSTLLPNFENITKFATHGPAVAQVFGPVQYFLQYPTHQILPQFWAFAVLSAVSNTGWTWGMWSNNCHTCVAPELLDA